MIKLESFGTSDIGHKRDNNEDVFISMPRYRFFALADGMGGHNAGEIAAKETIDFLGRSIKELIHPQKKAKIPTRDLINHLKSAIENANSLVHSLGNENHELRGMGTTLCCLYLYEDAVIYAHVGDSRIYRFREDELKQLTEDHALLMESKINKGTYKHIITKAIGITREVDISIASATVQKGDIFLLATDGLTDSVRLNEIEEILRGPKSLKIKGANLVKIAKEKGGHDNITLILIKII